MALNEGEHVMLSYDWKSQDFVSKVYDSLMEAGIATWMDIKGGMADKPNSRYEPQQDRFSLIL
jgi:hypothetical protein